MSKKILILEDHPGLGQLITDLFKSHDFTATLAVNGQEGLDYAREGGYDAIITDIKMPLIDGIQFLRSLKENPPKKKNGPILVYSNFAYQYSKDEVISLGAADFIAKDTIGTGELVTYIEELIKKHPLSN
jgi:DNA-binding response OmpR family regulator